jgi:hypothetical protein
MKNDWTPQDLAQIWTSRHHIRHIGTNKIAKNRTRSRGKVCHSRKIRPKRRREPRVICWRTAMTCHEEEADTNQAKRKQPTSPTVLEFVAPQWQSHQWAERIVNQNSFFSRLSRLTARCTTPEQMKWVENVPTQHVPFDSPRSSAQILARWLRTGEKSYTAADRLLAWP